MVCSPGRAPTQSQLVHYQRANVAMSRARDQCILVRSLDITDIPSNDDVKIPIITFFQTSSIVSIDGDHGADEPSDDRSLESSKAPALRLLVLHLSELGYKVRSMGIVWKNGVCVEHSNTDVRVALMVDDPNDLYPDWQAGYQQQQKIERVGWKCLRVDLLSLLSDFMGTVQSITQFLRDAGIDSFAVNSSCANDQNDYNTFALDDRRGELRHDEAADVIDDIITITSEDEENVIENGTRNDDDDDTKNPYIPEDVSSARRRKRGRVDALGNADQCSYSEVNQETDDSEYGFESDESAVVDLSFLRHGGT